MVGPTNRDIVTLEAQQRPNRYLMITREFPDGPIIETASNVAHDEGAEAAGPFISGYSRHVTLQCPECSRQ